MPVALAVGSLARSGHSGDLIIIHSSTRIFSPTTSARPLLLLFFSHTHRLAQVYSIRNSEADVPVVVMIATYDANGDTSDERKFSFYCTRLYDSCVSVTMPPGARSPSFSLSLFLCARHSRARSACDLAALTLVSLVSLPALHLFCPDSLSLCAFSSFSLRHYFLIILRRSTATTAMRLCLSPRSTSSP